MPENLFVFALDGQQWALPLAAIVRVVQAVQVTPLPAAPRNVLGLINLHGRVVPLIDLHAARRKDGAPREIELSDRFIIARTAQRTVALLADAIPGVLPVEADIVAAERLAPGLQGIRGVLPGGGGFVFIQDLEALPDIQEQLEAHLGAVQGEGVQGESVQGEGAP